MLAFFDTPVPSLTLIFLIIALAPLGCFLAWQRMAFFSDGLSHACTLGVPLALMFHIHVFAGIAFIAACIVLIWLALERRTTLSLDSIYALLAYTSFAGAVVFMSIIKSNVDLEDVLVGNFFAIGKTELIMASLACLATLLIVKRYWSALVLHTLSPDLARTTIPHMQHIHVMQMLLSAGMVALGMHMLGASLLPGLMIFPPCCARLVSTSPKQMIFYAIAFAATGSLSGIELARHFDTKVSPMIIVCGGILFAITLAVKRLQSLSRKNQAPLSPAQVDARP